jgi:uncharacterized protein YbjT (DUF2867 family)
MRTPKPSEKQSACRPLPGGKQSAPALSSKDRAQGKSVKKPSVKAADDVAKAVGRVAEGAPLNGTVEVAGPQQFRFDELIRQGLGARNDPREVVVDPHARYFGAELGERSLIPADDARLGEIRFQEWLNQPVLQR